MGVKDVLKKLCRFDEINSLPKPIIFTAFILFFIDAMTITTVFSYLPQLVKSFGATEVNAGTQAGIIGSALFVPRIVSSFMWGYFADKKSNKVAIICAASGLCGFTFLFGFSRTLKWAIVARFFQGVFSGVVVITKSIISEACNDTNLTLAFSILFSGYQIGLLIGPSMAGFLVFPADQYPDTFTHDSFFGKFGIFLPNAIITVGFIAAILLSIFILPNKKLQKENYEIILQDEDSQINQKMLNSSESYLNLSIDVEIHPLNLNGENSALINKKLSWFEKFKESNMGIIIRTKDCLSSVILYGVFAIVSIGYAEIFPVYAATTKDFGGLGMSTSEIGTMFLIVAVFLIILQITLMPKVIVHFGPKKAFCGLLLTYAFASSFVPLLGSIKNRTAMWSAVIVSQIVMRITAAGGFTTVNLFVNNSVDEQYIGSANGLGMSVSSIGRFIGPILYGNAYSWSMSNVTSRKYGFPFNQYFMFFVNSFICIFIVIYVATFPSHIDKKKVKNTSDLTEKKKIKITLSEFTY